MGCKFCWIFGVLYFVKKINYLFIYITLYGYQHLRKNFEQQIKILIVYDKHNEINIKNWIIYKLNLKRCKIM